MNNCLYVILLIVILIPLIMFSVLLCFELLKENKTSDLLLESSDSIQIIDKNNIIIPPKLHFITRDEWIAQEATESFNNLEHPINRVIITHTATENCTTQVSCIFQTRVLQSYHMESRGWNDIGYNFLIGGDGAAYEGRGWDREGVHTRGYNRGSICITFIGTFNKYPPSKQQIDTALFLLEEGVRLGKLGNNYKLYGQRQLLRTFNPGMKLFEIIKKWQHFSENHL